MKKCETIRQELDKTNKLIERLGNLIINDTPKWQELEEQDPQPKSFIELKYQLEAAISKRRTLEWVLIN